MSAEWKPGDRVWLRPQGKNGERVEGTVREVVTDPRPGVIVDFDQPLGFSSWCLATHAELRPLPAPAAPGSDTEDRECHASRDGDCSWTACPQLRDGEPVASGRHCPLDTEDREGQQP